MNIAALAKACEPSCSMPPVQASDAKGAAMPRSGRRAERSGTDSRSARPSNRRSAVSAAPAAAPARCRTGSRQRREWPGSGAGGGRVRGQDIEPEPQDDEERALDDQRRQDRRWLRPARRHGRRAARDAAGRGPSWRAGRPSSARRRRRSTGSARGHLCKQHDIERAIGAIDQRDAEQIEHRAQQREQQVAQRRRQRLACCRRGRQAARRRRSAIRARHRG